MRALTRTGVSLYGRRGLLAGAGGGGGACVVIVIGVRDRHGPPPRWLCGSTVCVFDEAEPVSFLGFLQELRSCLPPEHKWIGGGWAE